MSISAISSSSTYASSYSNNSTSRRKTSGSGDDPMSQAISSLQSSDPTLASKLTDLQKQVDTMKKNGSSEKDIQSTIKSTMDGLSDTEKSELKSAMPTPPSGGPQGAPPSGGGHHHHKTSSSSDSDSSSSDSSDSSTFSASSLLDSTSSMQNDSIMSLLSDRSSASVM